MNAVTHPEAPALSGPLLRLERRAVDRPSIDRVIEVVAGYYHVTPQDIHGPERGSWAAHPRKVAMWVMRHRHARSLVKIGCAMNRAHTTVLRDCRSIEREAAIDATLSAQIVELEKQLATPASREAR